MGTAGHGHVMDDCLKGSNALFYSQAFCLDTQVSCRPEKREAVSACKRFWASHWGSVPPLCPLLARLPCCGIRHCVFCKRVLTAGWWTTRRPSQGLQS